MFLFLKKISLFSCIGIGLLFPLGLLHAQITQNVFEPSVEIALNPENPGPNTNVTAELTTNSFDLNAAFIGWAINGKVVKQGVGEKQLSFTTRSAGQIIQLEAILQDPSTGRVIQRETTIVPGEIDIIWEVQGYTPPFYEGKAHPTYQSTIVFTAVTQLITPDGQISTDDLIYTWYKNNSPIQESSGYGKKTAIISQDFLSRPFTLRVVATTRDGNISLEDSVSISSERPQLIVYEEDPLLGLRLEKSVSSPFVLNKDELWLRAIPYFSDTLDRNSGNSSITWKMNGQTIQEGPLEERVVLRRPAGIDRGQVSLSLSFKSGGKILQSLDQNISLLIEPLTNNSVF